MQAIPASSTVLPAEVCVVRYALERHARERGDDTFAVFEDGGSWAFAGLLQEVQAAAAALQAIGVGQGDRVLVMMPNGAFGLRVMFAANYLGAVFVPVNTAYKGRRCSMSSATPARSLPSSTRGFWTGCWKFPRAS